MTAMTTAEPKSPAPCERARFSPMGIGLLQRKCACGGNPGVDGQCEECREKKLQRKGVVPTSANQTRVAPPIVHEVLRSPGQPLDAETRAFMEPRLAHDFGQVRVHTDDRAAESARAVNALAYTVGSKIVFGRGGYRPASVEGSQLLAHELVHVCQQRHAAINPNKDIFIGTEQSGEEQEADLLASEKLSIEPKALVHESYKFGKSCSSWHPIENANGVSVLRRLTFRERLTGALDKIGSAVSPRTRQAVSDFYESIHQSPEHFAEFFTGELYETVKQHWGRILAVTLALFGAEFLIGALGAAPTGVTQVIAAILEVFTLALLGYFAAVEVTGATEEGIKWWTAAREANGDAQRIADASRSFVRMIWHIVMAIVALAGVRARIRAGALGRVAAPFQPPPEAPPPSTGPKLEVLQGGRPGQVPMQDGRIVSQPQATASNTFSRPATMSGSAAARALQPETVPQEVPPRLQEVPKPVPEPNAGPRATPALKRLPTPKPFIRPDVPPEGEIDKHGCRTEPIAMKFGRFPCHADFAKSLSGESREFRVTTSEGVSMDFDAKDIAGNLYEVKTGYSWVWSKRPDLQRRISEIKIRFIEQAASQLEVASRCGRSLTWYFNEAPAASFFEQRQPLPVTVKYRPFKCDQDSDG